MPLTEEEYNYFINGINTFRSAEVRAEGLQAIKKHRSSGEITKDLNDVVNGDFVSIVSSKGISLTPASIIPESNSDLARIQTFVGYTPPLPNPPEQPGSNILESVTILSSTINNTISHF